MDLFSDRYITNDERGTDQEPHGNGIFPGGREVFPEGCINRSTGGDDRRQSNQINVIRRVYEQDELNKDADYRMPKRTLWNRCRKLGYRLGYNSCLSSSVPIVQWLPNYKVREYLMGDLISGATSAVMHIPQGMAYALLAEVPPVVGMYMAFFPVLLYVIFGTSPHVSMGTFAVVCLMAGKVVIDITHGQPPLNSTITEDVVNATAASDTYTPLEIVSVICFTVGCIQVAMWMFRLGMLSTLLSEPLVSGFTCAASFHVLASQLKGLFGITIPKYAGNYKIIMTIIGVGTNIQNINWAAFIISVITCTCLFVYIYHIKPKISKRSRIPIPVELIAIVVGTLTCRYANLNKAYGVTVVGHIPTGLPNPALPRFELIPRVSLDAFIITMVSYSITMSMILIFANEEKTEVDPNQELLAMGASNVFGSMFACVPFCASISRSYIQNQSGSKTGLTSVVSALLILFVLLWIGPFFEALPHAVLSGIIFVSLTGMMMKVTDVIKFWKLSALDAIVWLVTFLTTLLINIDIGLLAGLLASVGSLFCRSQKPYTCLLGRVLNTDIYLDIKRYRAAEEIPGIKIFHYCGGLNFASKNIFRDTFYRKVGCMKQVEEPIPEAYDQSLTKSGSYQWDSNIANKVQCVIIDASALSYVDAPGVKTLVSVQSELMTLNITVFLVGANAPVLEMIDTFNSIEKDKFHVQTFPTIHDAVVYYQLTREKKVQPAIQITEPTVIIANNTDK